MLTAQTTVPSVPPAPLHWTDPAAFGYVVGVLITAAVVFLWAKSKFQDKRLDLQSQRLNEMNRTQTVVALAADPKVVDKALATGGVPVITRPTTTTEPHRP
jgi:hypothetical protein